VTTELTDYAEPVARNAWWRDKEVAVLIALVVAAYFVRIGDISMRGEEPTRAEVAFEMLESGDWIVPHVQGDIFTRPPLQNWLIAGSCVLCGSREAWVVRLPSVVAMLLITLLTYGYARTGLSRAASLAAAAAFPTFAEMFTTGCQAETEMVFIALVSAALMLWHWGHLRGWPALVTWVVAYTLVGLGVLCKGPQPVVYFCGSVVCYLVLTRQWRYLFSLSHVAGICVGAAVVLAWLVPCTLRTSWEQAWGMVMGDTSARFYNWTTRLVTEHMLIFPFELLGCILPWSLLLLGFLNRRLRHGLGDAGPHVLFMGMATSLAFASIWLPPDGQTRYLAPLYPCAAVLIGVVIECCMRADASALLLRGWGLWCHLLAVVMSGAGLIVVCAALFLSRHPKWGPWAEPVPLVALAYGVASIVLAIQTLRAAGGRDVARVRTGVLAIAAFMVITFTGIVTNAKIRRSEDQAGAMARLKAKLPPGQKLVSFGHVDLLFVFHYGQPVELVPVPKKEHDLGTDENLCFCFDSLNGSRPTLPFAWDELAVISMVRNRTPNPDRVVVVGRRRPAATARASVD
jgi:4-amino-4-deoxy-L-arabinose transferase-like glycosyltransferase